MEFETPPYDKILAQCKSTDNDAKIEGMAKLQALFEKGHFEIPDPDSLIVLLKSSLRTSNLHLTNATLSALPSILPHLICSTSDLIPSPSNTTEDVTSLNSSSSLFSTVDTSTLRLALPAFLQAGGLIDRLGDKEKTQNKAREALVLLGGYAFRSAASSSKPGKGIEAPIVIFEKFIKEAGLASKVWKVREQSILTLVQIRRNHNQFPIRQYLTLLVDCLEDTDPHVRDCCRQSVIELFSGGGVTDAARADLKKELSKKGVRKTIVDSVLSKVLATGPVGNLTHSEESESGVAPNGNKEYLPPSLAIQTKRLRVLSQNNNISRVISQSSTKDNLTPQVPTVSAPLNSTTENSEINSVYIASSRDLEYEFSAMLKPFEGKETEHNWASRERAIQRVRGMLKGDVHVRFSEPFLTAMKEGFILWSTKALASLRTTVAVNTCLLYSELSVALGTQLDPHCEILLTHLLRMASFTKKITAQQSQISVASIITHTSSQPRLIISLLWQTLQEKVVQARTFVIGHLKLYLEIHGHRSKAAIEATNALEILDKSIKRALSDPNPSVRETARLLFWDFENLWRENGLLILASLDATSRKQLEKVCPNPEAKSMSFPSTPTTKKSSVAAAIAASRAKAKVIATAPPTLRHQATSASHASISRRPGSPQTFPKSPSTSSDRPSMTSSAMSSSSHQFPPADLKRITNAPILPLTFHSRSNSGSSSQAERSASPLLDQNNKSRLSSPLTGAISGQKNQVANLSSLPSKPVGKRLLHPIISKDFGPEFSMHSDPLPDDEDLIMAQAIPIPEDDDFSDDEGSMQIVSFPIASKSNNRKHTSPVVKSSPVSTRSASISNALSTGSISDLATNQQPVVEDALRARAQQAESAAERLLELVEPEEDGIRHHSSFPPLLLKVAKANERTVPKTPLSKHTQLNYLKQTDNTNLVMKRAALFVDSPNRSQNPSDILQVQRQQTEWCSKWEALSGQNVSSSHKEQSARKRELQELISQLESNNADVEIFKRVAMFSMENKLEESFLIEEYNTAPQLSPTTSLPFNLWENSKLFDRLFKALMKLMEPIKTEEELSYGLIVVSELLQNQLGFLEGKEGDLFAMILRLRFCNKANVLEGTNAVRDLLTSNIDPIYGLTTMHARLKVFHSEALADESAEIKATSYAFGLIALGKFILRMPAEIAEEELPRLKTTLISSLNDRSSLIVRESAAACIIAAQLVLRDETHLFALLDGLADEKKNLLTYLFDKHGAREFGDLREHNGLEKLKKEIQRLDNRTSIPLRGVLP